MKTTTLFSLALMFVSLQLPTHAAIMEAVSPNEVRVFPNPWRADKDANSVIMFDRLPQPSTVKIFTVSGHEVRSLSADNGSAEWDRTNNAGDKVASGIYLFLVTDNQGNQTKGKLAIIK